MRCGVRWVLVSLFAATASVLSEDESTAKGTLTPEEEREVAALLDEAQRLLADSEADRKEIERTLSLLSSSIGTRLPAPVEADAPTPRTIEFAMPRGLAWLAAHQRVDGHWPGGVEPTASATILFASDTFTEMEPRVARLRVLMRDIAGTYAITVPADLQRLAVVTCALCRTSGVIRAEQINGALARHVDALLERVNEDRDAHALARAWAILALREYHALDKKPTCEWSAVLVRPAAEETAEIIAALLHRRAASEDDDTTHAQSRRLLSALRARTDIGGRPTLDEWYLGAIAMKGLPEWDEWKRAMTEEVLRGQRRDGAWCDGTDDLSTRIRSTALALLCLSTAVEP